MMVESFIKSYVTEAPNEVSKKKVDHFDCFYKAANDVGIKILTKKKKFKIFVFRGRKVGSACDMVTNLTSREARKICKDKRETLLRLKEHGVDIPYSKAFEPKSDYDAAYKWFSQNKKREKGLVLKPSNGRAGKGISIGVRTPKEFEEAWLLAYNNLTTEDGTILIEERLTGIDLRAIVVNGKFVCAATRLPAHVIGNGKNKVLELVHEKNLNRAKHAYYGPHPLNISKDIEQSYIPFDGEVFLVNNTSNIHQGGEALDLTEYVADSIKELAERAASSIPGLGVSGVDLILNESLTSGKVIEINTACNFMIHYYPYYGKSRNPAYDIFESMVKTPTPHKMIFENIGGSGSYLKRLMRYFYILKF
ncbi:ATP-grasp domain-containing protein [Halovibrio sp. HP20-50]|uniref:ATP-grasp domain-containing protein n=1 Tax=Halovibrio sp. HP20-59 TaxID=3080275 RepID=UPI00294B00AE|nr:ATP-grasp domain-containing protein [Halovibrio sp. HP20-59]MEA2120518.1 ATP-grasp domain-containing protein [Halovibrio sp. HP20-59]